jgi:hypothetical protein
LHLTRSAWQAGAAGCYIAKISNSRPLFLKQQAMDGLQNVGYEIKGADAGSSTTASAGSMGNVGRNFLFTLSTPSARPFNRSKISPSYDGTVCPEQRCSFLPSFGE